MFLKYYHNFRSKITTTLGIWARLPLSFLVISSLCSISEKASSSKDVAFASTGMQTGCEYKRILVQSHDDFSQSSTLHTKPVMYSVATQTHAKFHSTASVQVTSIREKISIQVGPKKPSSKSINDGSKPIPSKHSLSLLSWSQLSFQCANNDKVCRARCCEKSSKGILFICVNSNYKGLKKRQATWKIKPNYARTCNSCRCHFSQAYEKKTRQDLILLPNFAIERDCLRDTS